MLSISMCGSSYKFSILDLFVCPHQYSLLRNENYDIVIRVSSSSSTVHYLKVSVNTLTKCTENEWARYTRTACRLRGEPRSFSRNFKLFKAEKRAIRMREKEGRMDLANEKVL